MTINIQYMSDLHLEFGSKEINVHLSTDVIVLAGDIHTRPQILNKFFKKLKSQKDIPIVYVLGNHEYYGHSVDEVVSLYKDACSQKYDDIYLLDNESKTIGSVRFIGSTMHTDITGNEYPVISNMPDFRVVKGMSTDWWKEKNKKDIEFLVKSIGLHKARKNNDVPNSVVVTHFVPVHNNTVIPSCYRGSPSNAGFYQDMSKVIQDSGISAWIYGHNHYNVDFNIGEVCLLSNQYGYEFEDLPFKENKIFALNNSF